MGKGRDDECAIEVDGLTKRYGDVVALDRISFDVRQGEMYGFLGPNGAGKTTTVRMLTGVLRPDSGRATVCGYRAGSLEAKQMTGVVPEMCNAYIDLSGWENLMLMAKLYGVPKRIAESRSEELLREMGLYERRGELARGYSKGMKQRLVLSMALVSGPEVIFLDEPTSGLDVQSARLVRQMLRRLKSEGKTIFLTTHDMAEANELCDRVAVINKGRIIAVDSPEKLRMATSSRKSVEVVFSGEVDEDSLASLPDVIEVSRTGGRYRIYTRKPGDVAMAVVELAKSRGVRIVSLNTLAPTLEEAFLTLIQEEA